MIELKGKHNKDCKVFIDEVESSAYSLIQAILDNEVSRGVPVRIMPDTHAGVDIVIGFTMLLTDRVNPNHIGVDIGCGVRCVKIPKINLSLAEIDERIQRVIPMGFAHQARAKEIPHATDTELLAKKIGLDCESVFRQLGTLGGGNHFIEIGEHDDHWYLFIHSGSRNFGLQVANYHARKAKAKGSAYLFADDMQEYLADMYVAQAFAKHNRLFIEMAILDEFGVKAIEAFDTIHNYIDPNDKIIRKGAIRANEGEIVAIPMNMRDGILICRGKGNVDWNNSAPHGAGRILSRSKAKQQIDIEAYKTAMEGIYSSCVSKDTLDESPMAYKDAELIKSLIAPTVDVLFTVKPILNIKSK